MIKHFLLFTLLVLGIFQNVNASNHPDYVLLPNIHAQKNSFHIEQQLIEIVNKALNIPHDGTIKTVRLRTIYNDKQITAVIVYLLSAKYKSLQLIRINLDASLKPKRVIRNYMLRANDLTQSPYYANKQQPYCPDDKVQFVIGNNFHDYSVEREVKRTYGLAESYGYHPILMDVYNSQTPSPTVAAYVNWLSCPNVKGFYNESHGWKQGIVLADDDFVYSLVDKKLVNKLKRNVLLFDSCETFHNPLLFSMTNASRGNAQQYTAGYIMLPFGSSERTASCIWQNAFKRQPLNAQLIRMCAKQNGLDPEGFRIAGNGDIFLASPTIN